MLLIECATKVFGRLPEGLKERFAKPSLRKRRIGSNPIPSASFLKEEEFL